jgi:tetratricopeptide (TPR) repeat protein
MGGVGKTSLAVLAAHSIKDQFLDAQLFLDMRGMAEAPVTVTEALCRVIRDFHPESGNLPEKEADLLSLYRSVLRGKRALIVLDNVKDEAQVLPLLSVGPPVAFLITSRNALAIAGMESVRLDALPLNEAVSLVRGILGSKGSDNEVHMVVELCGCLPLALRVASDFLRLYENWTLSRYTEALRDESKRLDRLKGKSADRDVEAVLALSAKELVLENVESAARWQLLSVFPADFDSAAVAAAWDLDETATLDELTSLLARSMLEYEPETDRYELHDLMRLVAQDAFGYVSNHPMQIDVNERLQTAGCRISHHYQQYLNRLDLLYKQGNESNAAALTKFDLESRNIRHGWRWAAENNGREEGAAQLCRDYSNGGGDVALLRLSSQEQVDWSEAAVDACRHLKDRWSEGAALDNLGIAYTALGNASAAIVAHKQSLTIARELRDRTNEARVLGNLGVAYSALGDFRTAQTYHEEQLAIARELGDYRCLAGAMGSIGVIHAIMGDTPGALAFFEQVLTITRGAGDSRGEAATLGNLGNVCIRCGYIEMAIEHLSKQLEITRKLLDHQGEASAQGNLGNVHAKLGDYRNAINCYKEQVSKTREIKDRKGEAIALGNLGLAHFNLGDVKMAFIILEQSLIIANEIGDRHTEAFALYNKALAQQSVGERELALQNANRALEMFETAGSPEAETVRIALSEWCGGAAHPPKLSYTATLFSPTSVLAISLQQTPIYVDFITLE